MAPLYGTDMSEKNNSAMEENFIKDLDKVFDNRLRLGIMGVLSARESVSFNELKEILLHTDKNKEITQVTDGNLASHIKKLEENQYIEIKKIHINLKSNTSYVMTQKGREAFKRHLNALARIINQYNR
jgi:DNA-binding MarR family transcriptional regulator